MYQKNTVILYIAHQAVLHVIEGLFKNLMQDMETFICRQTLTGHKDDVLSISGLSAPSCFVLDDAALPPAPLENGGAAQHASDPRDAPEVWCLSCWPDDGRTMWLLRILDVGCTTSHYKEGEEARCSRVPK